jgi:alpha-soluble NSF attachment protein
MFKMAKKWGNAGEAFFKAADLHLKNGTKHEAATNFVDAATCYKKCDTKGNNTTQINRETKPCAIIIVIESVTCLNNAIDLYQEMGRFSIAAKHNQTIAEILEGDGDLGASILYYEKAADMFKGEESNAAANKALLKVAAHAALMEDYVKATRVYEEVIIHSQIYMRLNTALNLDRLNKPGILTFEILGQGILFPRRALSSLCGFFECANSACEVC